MDQPLILASASPRRRELVGYMGIPFEVICADAEELKEGAPEELVQENALRKAQAVAVQHPGRLVLGADTLVCQNGRVMGKPRNEEEARDMIARLAGNWHEVYTGVCLMQNDRKDVRFDVSRVQFVPLSPETIAAYVKTGEPMDKAGAYAIQGKAGMFISRMEGSYSNVIGLPLSLVRDMLMDAGIENL